MFVRTAAAYTIEDNDASHVLADGSSPIRMISENVRSGSKVLDIGCGNGVLARVLKIKSKDIVIDGVEPNAHAAELSRPYYRNVYIGYAQDFYTIIAQEAYDYVVLADVIEHIANPYDFLSNLLKHLSEKTKILVSIPNIAFATVRLSLLQGEFEYRDTGLIERTHLRFFTLKTVETLFSELEIFIEKLFYLQRSLFSTEIRIEELSVNPLHLLFMPKDVTASTYQFLFVLSKKRCPREDVVVGRSERQLLLRYFWIRYKNSGLVRVLNYARNLIRRKRSITGKQASPIS
jgi:2-polyprenyl-3-methyl-5-hydroxy-6-metoxy-1,4-benzoquinol methylase